MDLNKVIECEAKQLQKFRLLPNSYKRIGLMLVLASFTSLFVLAAFEAADIFKTFAKNGMLIGMLLISLSKERIEDEYIKSLRTRSFMMALAIGVLYAVIQPVVNYGVGELLQPGQNPFSELSAFQTVWFMLVIQLAFYYVLKATR